MRSGEKRRQKVKKISISLSGDVIDWIDSNKGDLKVSTFINQSLRDHMGGLQKSSCNVCQELESLKDRLKLLEEDIHDLRQVRSRQAGKLGTQEHVSIVSTRPRDVFGQLVNIKNVSANNAKAVYEELAAFLKSRDYVDRQVVLDQLFPHTRSTITNNINYWYNACRGVLDRLIEEGNVVRFDKNKYRWVGRS